jgi:amino acid transporter
VASAIPQLGHYSLEITIGVVLVMCYINLRGLREAGRPFAIPAYFFVSMVLLMIVVGVVKAVLGDLPRFDPTQLHGAYPVSKGNGFVAGATLFVLLRAFANGGSSLTGVEAISNTVSAFRKPEGHNARKVLTVMALLLGLMVGGVSLLAYLTHAMPYEAGYPSVLSQEAQAVYGYGWFGTAMFWIVQAATALILYTGGNTSFNGFPFLASFVASDRFLPRQLTRRGHRLVFSNGIIVLTVLSVLLLLVAGSNVNNLVPFYAIGVFTGFAMAGYGMTKHWLNNRERGWRKKLAINLSAGVLSTIVVIIFAIAKFTEGAWLVVVVFPILVFTLIRLNREYRVESAILDRVLDQQVKATVYPNHKVFVFVNSLDLAVLEALRYGRGLRPSELKAVHFMLDEVHANRLRDRWEKMDVPATLTVLDCPDRRLSRAAQDLVLHAIGDGGDTGVTVLLPRRTYAPLLGRLLHDRSADRMARVISRVPQAAATIVPYDVQSRIRAAFPDLPEERITGAFERLLNRLIGDEPEVREHMEPKAGKDSTPLGSLIPGRQATVSGRLSEIEVGRHRGRSVLACELRDSTGSVKVRFSGEHPDIEAGQRIRLRGRVRLEPADDSMVLVDPAYEVLEDPYAEEMPESHDS